MEKKLTERQRRFADAYLEKRLSELDAKRVASANEVLEYWTRVMRGEEGGGGQAAMKAAELLGRRMGLFSESVERPEAPVIVDDVPGGEEGDG